MEKTVGSIKYFWMLLISLLVACASTPKIPVAGETFADPILINDTQRVIAMVTDAMGCNKIENIQTIITEQVTGEPGAKISKENWVAHGCDTTFSYDVTFTEDGKGGTYFSVSTATK